MNRKHLKF